MVYKVKRRRPRIELWETVKGTSNSQKTVLWFHFCVPFARKNLSTTPQYDRISASLTKNHLYVIVLEASKKFNNVRVTAFLDFTDVATVNVELQKGPKDNYI